jgi:chromate transporter
VSAGHGAAPSRATASLGVIAREWTRIGVVGFGGPAAHIGLLRELVVERRRWIEPRAFEDAIAACNLLPGPASTQLAIFCAYRVGGRLGAIVGGLGFVAPAVAMVLVLSLLFLAKKPPLWVRGAGAGAGGAVAAVALRTGVDLLGRSYLRASEDTARALRWLAYLSSGAIAAALVGPYLVFVLLGCGLVELALERRGGRQAASLWPGLLPIATAKGGLAALAWTAFKVGALAFGGGFVIVPLMQADAVHTYHWMSNAQFLNAVALGQVTPGPVVATVAAVGYAARGLGGGLLASAIAFAPSFSFVLIGGLRFERLRQSRPARAFLDGAGPATIGAIVGAAVPLAGALPEAWQAGVLAVAAIALLALRRGIVATLLASAVVGVVVVLAGAPVS